MLADLFGKTVTTTNASEGSALGAAILAGAGTGVYDFVAEGCDTVLRQKTMQKPDPAARKIYQARYPIYRSLYRSLKKEFVRLHQLDEV